MSRTKLVKAPRNKNRFFNCLYTDVGRLRYKEKESELPIYEHKSDLVANIEPCWEEFAWLEYFFF